MTEPHLSKRDRNRRRPFRTAQVPLGTERKCDWCSQPYQPHQMNQRFCQPDCRREHLDFKRAERHRKKLGLERGSWA